MKIYRIILFIIACLSFNETFSVFITGDGHPYLIKKQKIKVDGNTKDWESLTPVLVQDRQNLWIGQGLEPEYWQGKQDLSFSWKVAWYNQKIFFLFEVIDDTLSDFTQQFTWLNDCIEIYIDPENRGGNRIEGINADNSIQDRIGKRIYGYEMHFLPDQPPKVYIDDTRAVYYTDSVQNTFFENTWKGEAVTRYTDNGYLMEIGFKIPDNRLKYGKIIGIDVAVCDDDGNGRKSLLLWSAVKGEFWITMDNFNKMTLSKGSIFNSKEK